MKNGDKMKLTEEQIKSIAEELEAGFEVYLNIETNEIKSIIDFDNNMAQIRNRGKKTLKK